MPPSPPSPRSRIQGDAYEDAGLRSSHGVTKGAARALLRMGVITRREYAQLLAASALVKQPPSSYPSGLPLSASARVALSSPRAPRREPPRRVCPISLEPVCAEATGSHSFCFSTLPAEGEGGGQEGGSEKERACVVWYDVRALCSYLITTGNFVEPTSRRPIGAKDVEVRGKEGGSSEGGRGNGRSDLGCTGVREGWRSPAVPPTLRACGRGKAGRWGCSVARHACVANHPPAV